MYGGGCGDDGDSIGELLCMGMTRPTFPNVLKLLQDPSVCDRIPSTTPGAEPPRDARDSGSARSHSTHLETSSSDRP